jgi:ATP-dependent DNA helicase RecQ
MLAEQFRMIRITVLMLFSLYGMQQSASKKCRSTGCKVFAHTAMHEEQLPEQLPPQDPEQSPAPRVLSQLGLTLHATPNLPPELRDALLAFVQTWGSAEEMLQLVTALREVHGPLLFLLDYHAQALYRLGRYDEALDLIERRQRRSSSVLTQMREAQALLAAGHQQHARSVALELGGTYPRNNGAVTVAAETLATLGDIETASTFLQTFLSYRPRDLLVTLALIGLTQQVEGRSAADEQLQRLGAGIPAGIRDEELRRLQVLAQELGRQQTAAAAELELGRRHQQQLKQLHRDLRAFVGEDNVLAEDPERFYRLHSGPESIPVNVQERSRIALDVIRHFGFDKLREGQVETMAAVLRGESILTVMPTGAGKSLCYQLPALVLPHATLVISPLIALMKDQVEGLPGAAQRLATFVNSSLSDAELVARMQAIAEGKFKLIYAAPERLRQRTFLGALRQAKISLFVVDEAHCVSMWGHDFRPDYLFIEEARHELGNPPALAMTATAPPRVRDEIVEYISNEVDESEATTPDRPRVIALDIFRPNLHLSAIQFHNEDEKQDALLKFVATTEGSGIVYVNSRHKAEMLAFALRSAGVQAEAYHAGLESTRGQVQDRFMKGTTRVIVATIAFGMGIDKPDIRFIVHFHPSRSLDSYYQEVGRAGRDGKLSHGVLFYSINDWASLRRWAASDEYKVEFLEQVYKAIATQLSDSQPAEGEAEVATIGGPIDARRLQQVISTEGKKVDETAVRVAISLLERADLLARGFDLSQELIVAIPKGLPSSARENKSMQRLLKGLALGPGQAAAFATTDIARFMRWEAYDVESRLLRWQADGWLTVRGSRRSMYMQLPPRPADAQQRLERLLTHAQALAQRRIEDMIGYATSETCRHGYISAHFGSPPRTRCSVCDNCTGLRPDIHAPELVMHLAPDVVDVEPMILDCLVSLPRPVGRSGLARILVGALRAPFGPDKARHFGALKGLGEAAVSERIDKLIEDERLRQYPANGFPVVTPTLRGRAVAEAWLAEHPDLGVYGDPLPGQAPAAAEAEAAEGDKYTGLQKALWLWRRRTAEELGQPVYVIMSNEVMLRVAELRPQSLDALGAVPGIGAQRLQHYGAAILDIIKLHPAQAGDAELLSTQRQVLAEASEGGKAAAGKIRQAAASASSPQLERKILMRLQEIRQKRAVAERSKPYSIAPDNLLRAIAQQAPASADDLYAIPGFRSSGLASDATQILTAIATLRG